jgi:hypothetical protein
MARMSMNHLVSAFRWGGCFLAMAGLVACSSSKPLTGTGQDAASAGSAGASGTGSSGSSGGDSGRGGSSNAGGSSAGGVTGSAGHSGSGGASAGSTGVGGSSGGASGPSDSKVPDAGAGSGGSAGAGGSGGKGGAGGSAGKSSDVPGRDAAVSSDVSLDGPRSDSLSPDRGSPDVSRDTGRTDALSAAAQEYVTTFAAPYCSRLAACCAQNGFPTPKPGACEANELGYVKDLDDGSAVINPTGIQTILTMLQDSCDQPSYALLARTTKGTRAAGEPCDSVDQCASESGICLNGKCMVPPRGKAGDGCSVTCDDYTSCKWTTSEGKSPYVMCYEADGLYCAYESHTCVALKAAGAACADFNECGTHADCTNGICVARTKLGADCSRTSCDRGLQCGNGTGSAYICQKASIAWSGSCSP